MGTNTTRAGFEECLRQVIFWATRFENRLEVRGNRTGRGWFKKGHSGNPVWSAEKPSSTPGIRS